MNGTDAPKPRPRRLKLHKVRAGQDFGVRDFDFGAEGRWFDVEDVGEALQCTAEGYGKPGDYGNGAIYLRRCWTPEFFLAKESDEMKPAHACQELYDRLLYLAWCDVCEREFELSDTHERWEAFKNSPDTEVHFGDCCKDICTCERCLLHSCEIEAERRYRYLYSAIKPKGE